MDQFDTWLKNCKMNYSNGGYMGKIIISAFLVLISTSAFSVSVATSSSSDSSSRTNLIPPPRHSVVISKVRYLYIVKEQNGDSILNIAADVRSDVVYATNQQADQVITMGIPLNAKNESCKSVIESAFQLKKLAPNSKVHLSLNLSAIQQQRGASLSYQKVQLASCYLE